jgi:hypothetical protein
MRATVGGRLRKALKHRDPRVRTQRLMAALADIDGFARRYLVARALKRLTKLNAVVMFAPPAGAVVSLCAVLALADRSAPRNVSRLRAIMPAGCRRSSERDFLRRDEPVSPRAPECAYCRA